MYLVAHIQLKLLKLDINVQSISDATKSNGYAN